MIKMRIIRMEMLLSVDLDLRMLSTRSMVKLKKKEENTNISTLVTVSSRAVRREKKMVRRKIIRKSSTVDSLLYSSRNVETVREQMLQIDMFKQVMDVHKEYNSLLPLEAQEGDKKWFDDTDADRLVFKQKIHNWIREAEHDRDAELKEKASVKSKRSSKSSSKSLSSSPSKN